MNCQLASQTLLSLETLFHPKRMFCHIWLIARNFPRPHGARKNTTQLSSQNIHPYYMFNYRIRCRKLRRDYVVYWLEQKRTLSSLASAPSINKSCDNNTQNVWLICISRSKRLSLRVKKELCIFNSVMRIYTMYFMKVPNCKVNVLWVGFLFKLLRYSKK